MRLADPAYLFNGPASDPLNGVPDGASGLDWVKLALKRDWSGRRGYETLQLSLPAEQLAPGLAARLEAAIGAHMAVRLADEEANRLLHGRERSRAWLVGLAFLAACLIGSLLVDRFFPAGSLISTLLRESLVIAGWVGLWRPLELALYDWWPIRFRTEMADTIARLRVEVVPER